MTKLVTILIVSSLLLLVVACNASKPASDKPVGSAVVNNPDTLGKIVSLEYVEHGTMAQPTEYFKLVLEKGKVKVKRQRGSMVEEFTTDASVMDSLTKVYIDCNVGEWKSNYQPSIEVMDGYSWNFEAKFDNGRYKYSHGNNARPGSNGLKEFSTVVWNIKK